MLKLEFDFGKNVTEPGSEVSLRIKSTANSLVSLCVIDTSIELMQKPIELTQELVSNLTGSFKLSSIDSWYSWGATTEKKLLNVGIFFFKKYFFRIFNMLILLLRNSVLLQ
jgi:hypothetical protein